MTTLTDTLPARAAGDQTFLGHPRGLFVIFATEMWERFSYYGMRAILVYYLTQSMGYQREDALALYGIYTALVYLTPILGGWLADRYLGLRKGAVVGATVMVLGHFAMAVPSLLHVALGLLIAGNGFFKPNTSSMVGECYDGKDDPRRDGGYSIFYMGINLGAFFSPLVCGTLGEKYGYHYGFAAAGVGMAIGLVTLVSLQGILGRAGLREGQSPVGARDVPGIAAWTIASVAVVYAVVYGWSPIGAFLHTLPTWVTTVIGLAMILGFLAAHALARVRLPGSALMRGVLIAPMTVSYLIIALGLLNLFNLTGVRLNINAKDHAQINTPEGTLDLNIGGAPGTSPGQDGSNGSIDGRVQAKFPKAGQ